MEPYDDCIFCRIALSRSPGQIEWEDDRVAVFWDIEPAAKVHLLIVPKKHISSLATTSEDDQLLLGHMMLVARNLAHQKGYEKDGYRLIINTGQNSGQVVDHLHMHLLAGENLGPLRAATKEISNI